ncbi:MAG: hypothetical protein AB1640_18925 [bacterium]
MFPSRAREAYEAYLEGYSPDRFLEFYNALAGELNLFANPDRAIPISPVPLLLDRSHEEVFSRLIGLFWRVLEDKRYRQLSAERIPPPLQPALQEGARPAMDFAGNGSIGCIDLHLVGGVPRVVEFMVLPPGMVGIYPGMLERYGEYLRTLVPGCSPRIFLEGADRWSCEDLMHRQVVGEGREGRFAIVDWEPERQITYGEFLYTTDAVRSRFGVEGLVADPREVVWGQGGVSIRGLPVDRILNRLTLVDWIANLHALGEYTRILRERPQIFVYHPYCWYLGDKFSLAVLSDPAALEQMDISEMDRRRLAEVLPATVHLADYADADTGRVNARRLTDRLGPPGQIVLKPLSSHASKGVVFGPVDTPTMARLEKVLEGIDPAQYVAMKLAPVPEIVVPRGGGEREVWKSDVRIFALGGRFLFAGGRTYVGDFTNQTPCRGFAPLYFI